MLFNSSREPANRCFETPGKSLPSGGMDLSRCQFGLPLVLSYPHFYAADSKYLEKVEGLSPNQERHQFQIDIEPVGFVFCIRILRTVRFCNHFFTLIFTMREGAFVYGHCSLFRSLHACIVPNITASGHNVRAVCESSDQRQIGARRLPEIFPFCSRTSVPCFLAGCCE